MEYSSSKVGLITSVTKSCSQHIDVSGDAPAVTAADIESLNPKFECPKPWCTRRFTNTTPVRTHFLWHDNREGGGIDQDELAKGQVIAVRGPAEYRFFLVLWANGELK